jgi:hypothetical protein
MRSNLSQSDIQATILFTGLPRHANNPKVVESVRAIMDQCKSVSVYAQMWYGQNYSKSSSWAISHGSSVDPGKSISKTVIKEFTDNYKPVSMLIEQPLDKTDVLRQRFDPEILSILEDRFADNQYYSVDNLYNIASQFTALENGYSILQSIGEVLIVLRYDAVVKPIPRLADLVHAHKLYIPHGLNFNDLILITTSSIVNPFKGLTYLLYNDVEFAKRIELPIPECYRTEHSKSLSIEIGKINMYAEVIRT